PSETYLTLELAATNLVGQWDVAVKDLEQGLNLDPDRIARLSRADLDERLEGQTLDVLAHLVIKADGTPLSLHATDYVAIPLNNGDYIRVRFAADMAVVPGSLALNARALFVLDPNMHGLFRLEHDGRTESVSFDNQHPTYEFELEGATNRWGQWRSF